MKYTIQAANDDSATLRPIQESAVNAWVTIYDGETTADAARNIINRAKELNKHVRAFRGESCLGREWS